MQRLLIDGKKILSGSITISGSKNATLPILAATILNKNTTISNIPFVNDIFTMIELLKSIGLRCKLSKKKKSVEVINEKKKYTYRCSLQTSKNNESRNFSIRTFTS